MQPHFAVIIDDVSARVIVKIFRVSSRMFAIWSPTFGWSHIHQDSLQSFCDFMCKMWLFLWLDGFLYLYKKRGDNEKKVSVCRLFKHCQTQSDTKKTSMDATVTVDVLKIDTAIGILKWQKISKIKSSQWTMFFFWAVSVKRHNIYSSLMADFAPCTGTEHAASKLLGPL